MSNQSVSENAALERGRTAFATKAWGEAYAQLTAADRATPLAPGDIVLLAITSHLIGRDPEGIDLLARAHQEFLRVGDAESAGRCAFWLGFQLFTSGEPAKGNGWLARARRVVDEARLDSATIGYLQLPAAIRCLQLGDPTGALATFSEALDVGVRFGDRELQTIARQGQGRALIRLGRIPEGIALLDEIMIATTAGEVSPPSVGAMYCSVLEACHEVYDFRRAQEWTDALNDWQASQPDLVPYRGHCLVRRAEMLHLHGDWSSAMEAAMRACEWLSHPPQPAIGEAHYQRAEVHRLRGELAEAEEAYRQASAVGRSPHPGLALVRLAQQQRSAAVVAIRHALDEAREQRLRSRMLGGYVEVMLAADDVGAARAGVTELASIAEKVDAPFLHALAAHWTGAVLQAEGDYDASMGELRKACAGWRELGAPYENASAHVLLARAQRALGDEGGAQMELDCARRMFQELGALPDVQRVEALLSPPRVAGESSSLTSREVEVLRLIATGKTNRAIAQALRISEKTVARHVSNIFVKLDLSSRAAATAYAYEHDLVGPGT